MSTLNVQLCSKPYMWEQLLVGMCYSWLPRNKTLRILMPGSFNLASILANQEGDGNDNIIKQKV